MPLLTCSTLFFSFFFLFSLSFSFFPESDITMPKGLSQPSRYGTNFSANQYELHIPGVSYVTGKVSSVTQGGDGAFSVELEGSKEGSSTSPLVAAAVVVCTGFSSGMIKPSIGITYADRKLELDSYRTAISEASNVIIAGGGAVGVDVSGEVLKMLPPGGKITHVVTDPSRYLTDRHSEAERDLVTARVATFSNVTTMFGDRVVGGTAGLGEPIVEKGREYTLKSGKNVAADVYIPAFAVWDRAQFLSGTAGALAPNGSVAVDKASLMSAAMVNLYAVGCSDNGEMCAQPKIEGQAATVAKNLCSTLAGGEPGFKHAEKMAWYKAEGMILHGDWGMVATDEMGAAGACCTACGFPFFCCLAPCLPACGACGVNCAKPAGKWQGKCVDCVMGAGPFGPVLGGKNSNAAPPGEAKMQR